MLVSPAWEIKFPFVIFKALERALSDHVPLLLETSDQIKRDPIFRFELCWLERDDLYDLVAQS